MTLHRGVTVSRTFAQWLGRLGVLCLLASGPPALSQDIFTDSFTGVIIGGNVGGNLGPFPRTTVDGPTHFDYTRIADTAHFSPGWLIAEGDAHFGTLGARVEIGGDSASYGFASAYFNDIHTPTGGALGTPDSFQLVFSLDGWVDVDYNANSDPQRTIEHVARASISANKYTSTGSFESLGGETVEVNYFYALGPGLTTTPFPAHYVSVTVPFVYGETFTLRTSLFVEAFMDTRFISSSGPPTFYTYGDGSINSVRADFHDTAKLIAVVNPNTGFGLAGQSGFDYQSIVTTEVSPIPEPGMVTMFATGCVVLGALRLRQRRAVTVRT